MKDKIRAMVLGSFVADALALGAHWVYNTNVIDKKFKRVEGYHDPLTSYHGGKTAGEHTHYGDQMLVLLESVEETSGFELESFAKRWRLLFDTYQGYFDHATKDTLENLSEGKDILSCGSASDDLAGASRIVPVCYAHYRNTDKLIQAARLQTAFTHNNTTVIDAAEFFGRTVVKVLDGVSPLQAMDEVVNDNFKGKAIETLVINGLNSKEVDTRQAVADFGQMCSIDSAFPGTIHLIAKYEDNFEVALVENVMAGGDSSARGMLVGMVLGAYQGFDVIPGLWLDGLKSKNRVVELIDSLDAKINLG
ncbi:MAG: ADP-ribosylglycohydrolase family protein [Deltaproteobacteria bacterium]|nr:ADP-ribosylglycohydrolase family protein [Deltaproteobacteria bacterium]